MKLIKTLIVFLLLSGVAYGQAVSPGILVGTATATSTDAAGDTITLGAYPYEVNIDGHRPDHWVARINMTENSGTATVIGYLQHSPDGTNWANLVTFTSLSSSGWEDVHINNFNTTVYEYIRAYFDFTGSGSWTGTIRLSYY